MAIITLEYDGRNPIARKTIEYVLSLGLFNRKEETPNSTTLKAMDELRTGKVTRCKNFDEYLKAVEE